MRYEKIARDQESSASCGLLHTDHGVIETPIFMPVGTAGTVKAVYHRDLKEDIKAIGTVTIQIGLSSGFQKQHLMN